jgi:hypothetical protein
MAVTQLADLKFGPNFNKYVVQRSLRTNAFAQAGVLVRDAAIDAMASSQGFLHNLPFFKAIANDEPNASTDNPADIAVPKKVTTGAEIARKIMRNQGWSSADLTTALISDDPLAVIGDQVGDYWGGVQETTLLKVCQGVAADNAANDGGDMTINVATDGAAVVGDAEAFTTNVAVKAGQTLGDRKASIVAWGVHSAVHADWQASGALVDNYDPATGELLFQTFMGKRVIIDDDMPVTIGANRTTYFSVGFGRGAFRYGYGAPKTPTSVERAESQGNGEGVETLWSRRHEILHPTGFAVTGTQASSSATPSYADLVTAANWDRVYDRKRVPLVFIKTNVRAL